MERWWLTKQVDTKWGPQRMGPQKAYNCPITGPAAPGPVTETLIHTSYNEAHVMESEQGVKKLNNYDCCPFIVDRDLQGRISKRRKLDIIPQI